MYNLDVKRITVVPAIGDKSLLCKIYDVIVKISIKSNVNLFYNLY